MAKNSLILSPPPAPCANIFLSGREISIPFSIVKYKKEFFCYFSRLGSIHAKKGNKETERVFKKIFQETARFAELVRRTKGKIAEKTVPYDIRTGKII